jgi:hypothetical protein
MAPLIQPWLLPTTTNFGTEGDGIGYGKRIIGQMDYIGA